MQDSANQNWAENVTYTARELACPTSLEELRRLVAEHGRVKALGSRHSFNDSADTPGLQVSVHALPPDVDLDTDAAGVRTVRCSAGLTHAQLSDELHRHGLALANLASLPHISVGGAIQTGTHGSGRTNPALSAAVTKVELVDAEGELRTLTRHDADFPAVAVGLGAFGVVTAVTQRVVEAFEVEQTVWEGARWDDLLDRLEEVMGCGYSVSLFTRFDSDRVQQVWVKRACGERPEAAPAVLQAVGAHPSAVPLHPLPETPADNVTEQLGVPGPSHHRLPHFRHDFKPGRGDEIQSEYLFGIGHAAEALQAVRRLGHLVAPLLHMAEVRRVAADDAWLSPSGGRDSLAIHFTWRSLPEEVMAILPVLEEALLPLGARPHWGKVFTCGYVDLRSAYPRLDDFARLVAAYDPTGKFDNAFLSRVLGR